MIHPRLTVALGLVVLGLTGCSAIGNAAGQPAPVTTTAQQARTKAEALVDATVAQVRPAMDWQASTVTATPNYTGIDGHYDGTALVSLARYAPVQVARDRLPTLEAAITRFWKDKGFRVQVSHSSGGNTFWADGYGSQIHLQAHSEGNDGVTVSADVGNFKGPANIQDLDSLFGGSVGGSAPPKPTGDPYWSH
ncbi:hypothetical protein [Streptacidiphilus sp. MAP5-3]|uniref:hypothetical protein n=1 Tax=unclassified Streptacidiphilus TaxID=2643834 RepID=UPI00351388B0